MDVSFNTETVLWMYIDGSISPLFKNIHLFFVASLMQL